MLALTVVGLVVSGSGCAPGGVGGAADVASTDPPTSQREIGDADPTDAGPDETVRGSSEVTEGPSRGGTPAPAGSPTAGATQAATTPLTSPTIVPAPTYPPYTMCPDIGELTPVLSAQKLGVDPQLGTDIVELTFTYTNPLEHALFLMGSVGYVDSEGYESDLYSRPGGLVFDDFRLERGTHTVVLQLEDIWGEAAGSIIYFTYWSLSGVALDSSRPVPCEPTRGYAVP